MSVIAGAFVVAATAGLAGTAWAGSDYNSVGTADDNSRVAGNLKAWGATEI
ncbi:hypothetical protein ABIB25_001259 [Nakamurella sp. UYEF19]|uniref:hypothetical protein n=1 Tax=Nakamurella sp. UYEF19 TaxID=1756392 RepID=UPI0033952FA0